MGTSPVVITANRQVGKSVFNSIISGSGIQSVWVDEFDHDTRQPYPRGETLKFKADPLALALAWRSQGWENWKIAEELMKSTTWDLVAHKESVEQSQAIKRYYRNKFMLKAFKTGQQNMSRFRQDLYNYVESDDPYTIYKNDVPMIVKLPDFFEEDTIMDNMVKQYKMDDKWYENSEGERTLYPLTRFHRKTKRTDQFYFWFRDINDLIYRISIEPKNPLLHLFEREFAKDIVKLKAAFYCTRIRGQDYTFYSMNNWKIL